MSKSLLFVLLFSLPFAFGVEGEDKALGRLSMTADMLVCIGEEMTGNPLSGILIAGDTLSINVNISSTYSYQFIVWTDSAFNCVDFWLTNPQGGTPRSDIGDHTALAIMPDSAETGIWQLEMELLEGAYSDTAYYAAAIFRRSRTLQ
ncbi:MAG: hypothetical protein K8S62_10395 [Candidatus Sabulitectum sp.]|nr:hypothetical protein [Candidatus Sabulitectum sp.]